jgi:hypothetical protein
MHYFALLLGPEPTDTPAPADHAAEMEAYQSFHQFAAATIRAGDALTAAADAVRISGGPHAPVVTDGPFAEGAEVAGGYYVFEADNLDDALALAERIPAAKRGGIELWPMVHWNAPSGPVGNDWLALLLEPAALVNTPGSEEFAKLAAAHVELANTIGDHFLGGAPLHPPATATTVRVRDGKTLLTDGPYVEGAEVAEVANGFYLLQARDRDEATKLASMIPASSVELRQLAGVSGL